MGTLSDHTTLHPLCQERMVPDSLRTSVLINDVKKTLNLPDLIDSFLSLSRSPARPPSTLRTWGVGVHTRVHMGGVCSREPACSQDHASPHVTRRPHTRNRVNRTAGAYPRSRMGELYAGWHNALYLPSRPPRMLALLPYALFPHVLRGYAHPSRLIRERSPCASVCRKTVPNINVYVKVKGTRRVVILASANLSADQIG